MKKTLISALAFSTVLILGSCAKEVTIGQNDGEKRYLESWISVNYPEISPSGLGIYVLDETIGDGVTVGDNGLALVEYKITDLEGNISSYSDATTARQLGEYEESSYYGPKFWTTYPTTIQAGLADAMVGMKAGGSKKVIIPNWLMTSKVYDNAEDYINPPVDKDGNSTSSSYAHTVYEFTVKDYTEDVAQWQIDSIGRFFKNKDIKIDGTPANELFAGMTAADSVSTGFYYKKLPYKNMEDAKDTISFKKDTTVYINYVGRLLNGQVFDTNIENIAKDNGLYSSSKEYTPTSIKWGETHSDITMGSNNSSVIAGFSLTLWQMKGRDRGVGVFYSNHGYQSSGSGASIPGYAPLIFEIEFVGKPED